MQLWTIQPEEVYQLIQKTGVYRCDPNRNWWKDPEDDPALRESLNRQFGGSYDWLVRQMEKRIGPRPDGVVYPIWAWERFAGKKKPDLRKERWSNGEPGKRMACILLDVPDEQVLLSDFHTWHFVLNGWPISDTEEEADRIDAWLESLSEEEKKAFLEENWTKIFDTEPFENGWTSRGRDVQATFWELKWEYVKGVRCFTACVRKRKTG